MRILLYDIETSPSIGAFYDLYREGNILWTIEEWRILSFAFKWYGEKTTHCRTLKDYSLYSSDPKNDKELVEDLYSLFQEADIIIGHNGDRFDIRKTNARFIRHGLTPPAPYKTVDTLKVAKKYFKFDSNRLDSLGEYLGVGRKIKTGGTELWRSVMDGDDKSWALMKRYNKQDVVLLENVYNVLRPWIHNHPIVHFSDEELKCRVCGSTNLTRRGFSYTASGKSKTQRYVCECGKWTHGRSIRTNQELT
jgi:DNA polymerase elongation subunit (family B)